MNLLPLTITGAAILLATNLAAVPLQTSGPYLASGKSKFLGSVYSTNDNYNRDYEIYWNGMWQGNSGKWGSVEVQRDNFNWGEFDQAYNFARAHNIVYQMHVLVWGNQQPSWIENLPPAEQLAEIREWFEAVNDRYPEMDYVQVVNEPLNDPPDGPGDGNYMAALGGTGETGFDWIINSFQMAREIFPPTTKLMINEYNTEGDYELAQRYVEVINKLKELGLVDAVGMQAHAFSTAPYTAEELKRNLDLIATCGLPIMLTEMEIDGLDDQEQLAEWQRVFPIYWEHPAVIGINISGHRIGNWRTAQGAYLAYEDDSPRPAFVWLKHYVQSQENWHGYDVTDNFADTGNWFGGSFYVGYNPWVYSDTFGWLWIEPGIEAGDGAWVWVQ